MVFAAIRSCVAKSNLAGQSSAKVSLNVSYSRRAEWISSTVAAL